MYGWPLRMPAVSSIRRALKIFIHIEQMELLKTSEKIKNKGDFLIENPLCLNYGLKIIF